jgi:hypothetical protein
MKVLALFLISCMVTFSALPAKTVAFKSELKKDCYHKPMKSSPCNHDKNDCSNQANCNILACSSCGFLKVDPISITAVVPIIKETAVIHYNAGDLSDYSLSTWHPPKV